MMLMFNLNLCDTLKKIMTSSGEDSFVFTIIEVDINFMGS